MSTIQGSEGFRKVVANQLAVLVKAGPASYGLWTLDLETGAFHRGPDFGWHREWIVCSPDFQKIVAPIEVPPRARWPTATVSSSVTLAVGEPGQPPRILPIRVPMLYATRLSPSYRTCMSVGWCHMAFLDENTLIYCGAGDSLWRYDLRTTAPECLWRPPVPRDPTVSGRIADLRGHPLPDLLVFLVAEREGCSKPHDTLMQSTRTDSSGQFRFGGVPPGAYFLDIESFLGRPPSSAGGLFGLTRRPKTGPLLIEQGTRITGLEFAIEGLEDRGGIQAHVTDALSGETIKALGVTVVKAESPLDAAPTHGLLLKRSRVASFSVPVTPGTKEGRRYGHPTNGAFRIESLSPGTATLEIRAEGYGCGRFRVPVRKAKTSTVTLSLSPGVGWLYYNVSIRKGETTTVTLPLHKESTLVGRVTSFGKPCQSGDVWLRFAGDAADLDDKYAHVRVKADGRFAYRELGPGDYWLDVAVVTRKDRPHTSIKDRFHVRVDPASTATLNIDLRRTAAIRGRFSAQKRGLQWKVSLYDASTTASAVSQFDRLRGTALNIEKTGKYVIENLDPGVYEVEGGCYPPHEPYTEAPPPPIHTQSKTIILRDGETATVDVDLK
jgi:hypothetical protein